jgi:hypothetical protein
MTSSAPMFFNFGKTTFDKVSTDVFYCQFEFRSYFIFCSINACLLLVLLMKSVEQSNSKEIGIYLFMVFETFFQQLVTEDFGKVYYLDLK